MIDSEKHLTKLQTDEFLTELVRIHGDRFVEYRKQWDQTCALDFIPDFPLHLELEVTNYCNLKCKMCHFSHYSHGKGGRVNTPIENIKKIFDQCAGRLPALLIGTGAESLLHPKIKTIIKMAHEAEIMDIILSTNGVLLDDSLIELLIDLQIARITISIDASTPETYKKIRGGDLRQVEKNIMSLAKKKKERQSQLPYLRVTFVRQEDNEHEVDAFTEKWLGVADRVDVQDLIELQGDNDETQITNDMIARTCSHPFQRLSVGHDGQVSPCCTFYNKFLVLGNINESSLDELWHGDKIKRLRKSLLDRDFCGACKKCLS